MKVNSKAPKAQTFDLIIAAAYRSSPDERKELFEAAEAFEEPKPKEYQYPLEPSTYGQDESAQK
jgi:hypothetical protein